MVGVPARGTKKDSLAAVFFHALSSTHWGPNPPDPLGRPSASESSLQTLYRVLFFVSPKFGRIWSLFSPRLKNRETDKLEFTCVCSNKQECLVSRNREAHSLQPLLRLFER